MEYLLLVALVFTVLWRGVLCGDVVDDVVMRKRMNTYKAMYKAGELKFIFLFRTAFYGAGLFSSKALDHLFSLAVHAASSCLIFKAFVTSFQNMHLPYYRETAFLGAALWALNPVNNQVSLWLNGRRWSLSILAILMAWNFKALAIPLYFAAVWIHVSSVTLPLLMLFTPWGILQALGMLAGLFFNRGYIMEIAKNRQSEFAPNNELHKIHFGKVIPYIKSIGYYFIHTVCPSKPRMFHTFLYYFGRTKKGLVQGYGLNLQFFVGLAVLAFLTYDLVARHDLWAVWFLVFISQWCNVYTVTMNASDRYCSLAGIGAMAIFAQYLAMIPAPWSYAVLAAVFTFYLMKYEPMFRAYLDYENYLKYHINLDPMGVEAYHVLSTTYLSSGDPIRAFAIVKEGLRRNPDDFKLLLGMVTIMQALGRHDNALKILDIAEKHAPLGEEDIAKEELGKARTAIKALMDQVKKPSGNKYSPGACEAKRLAGLAL